MCFAVWFTVYFEFRFSLHFAVLFSVYFELVFYCIWHCCLFYFVLYIFQFGLRCVMPEALCHLYSVLDVELRGLEGVEWAEIG